MDVDKPGFSRVIYPSGFPRYVIWTVVAISFVAVVATLYVLLFRKKKLRQRTKYVIFALWALIPPAWLSCEYFFLFKFYGAEKSFELFKYGQEISAKGWAAIVTVIAVILLKEKAPKPE